MRAAGDDEEEEVLIILLAVLGFVFRLKRRQGERDVAWQHVVAP